MKKFSIFANWKMNGLKNDLAKLIEVAKFFTQNTSLINLNRSNDNKVLLGFAVPATLLYPLQEELQQNIKQKSSISLVAQNASCHAQGAYTGEISSFMLRDIGCDYVILGHSERRLYYQETNDEIHKKVLLAQQAGLNPIICIGESKEHKINNTTFSFLEQQLAGSLPSAQECRVKNLTIAYEPVWAIGSGEVAQPEYIAKIHEFIKEFLLKHYAGLDIAKVRVIYGGSVKADNIEPIASLKDVDGVLLGSASLSSEEFIKILDCIIKKVNI